MLLLPLPTCLCACKHSASFTRSSLCYVCPMHIPRCLSVYQEVSGPLWRPLLNMCKPFWAPSTRSLEATVLGMLKRDIPVTMFTPHPFTCDCNHALCPIMHAGISCVPGSAQTRNICHYRRGVLDTSGLLGSHVLESNAWQMSRQPSRTARRSQAPGMLDTGATCKLLGICCIAAQAC